MSMGFLTGVLFARRAGLEGQDALISGVLGDTFNAASQPVGLVLTQRFAERRAEDLAPPLVVGPLPDNGGGDETQDEKVDLDGDLQAIKTSIIAAIAATDPEAALQEIANEASDGSNAAGNFKRLVRAAHHPATEQDLAHVERPLAAAILATIMIGADPLRALSVYEEAARHDDRDEVDSAIKFFAATPAYRSQLEVAAIAARDIELFSHDEARDDEDEENIEEIKRLQADNQRQEARIGEMGKDIQGLKTAHEDFERALKSIESKVDGSRPQARQKSTDG
jgi:hypothetical protein